MSLVVGSLETRPGEKGECNGWIRVSGFSSLRASG